MLIFSAEWQTSLEVSEKCPLCHIKMSVPQGKFAIQQKRLSSNDRITRHICLEVKS